MNNGWTGAQYSLFRFVFGTYLFVHFVQLLPRAAEMFAADGIVAKASDSPLYPLFPNLMFAWDSPVAAIGLIAIVDVADLTIGMLMIHAFTFDPDWFGSTAEVQKSSERVCRIHWYW